MTDLTTTEERNCAFQYAEMSTGIFRNTKIVHDAAELTLSEAKELWNSYYPQAARHIKNEGEVELVIWINMPDKYSYGESLEYISTDAGSDGNEIWESKRNYFTRKFKDQ